MRTSTVFWMLVVVVTVGTSACGSDGNGDADSNDVGTDATGDTDSDAADTGADDSGDAEIDTPPPPDPYPDPAGWGERAGSGVPAVTFETEELYTACAFLPGGPTDTEQHHNLVHLFDGYIFMPWAPESGNGGVTFFDLAEPCAPTVVGRALSEEMRETHSVGFVNIDGRDYTVTNHHRSEFEGGVMFWDITDRENPEWISEALLPGYQYPDSYARVTLSVFWQAPYAYVGSADNGVHILDVTDPHNPVLVGQHQFEPTLRAGQVQAIGNLLIVTPAEGSRLALLDISDPENPQPIPGGDIQMSLNFNAPAEPYFTNANGGYLYNAGRFGGISIFDIRDPTAPVYAGERFDIIEDLGAAGAYVFLHEGLAFEGLSEYARIWDVSDPAEPISLAKFPYPVEGADFDTLVPLGNLMVMSTDDGVELPRDGDGLEGQGSAVAPWREEPDTTPPVVNWVWPPDGATDLPVGSRFGVTFSEFIDPVSAWEGSVRFYTTAEDGEILPVDGWISVVENFVNFVPREDLEPGTTYTFKFPAGGIIDASGNLIEEPFEATFTTRGN